MNSKTKIVLADDRMFRQCLAALLNNEADMEVIGEAGTGDEAIAVCRELRPRILLMEAIMPGVPSCEVTRQLKREIKELAVVFLSIHEHRDLVYKAIDAGVKGYMHKSCPVEKLIDGLRKVSHNMICFSDTPLDHIFARAVASKSIGTGRKNTGLTQREREVLKLLADGESVKEIATQFELSVKTIEAHKQNMMRKLNIHDKTELVKYAISHRIISVPVMMDLEAVEA